MKNAWKGLVVGALTGMVGGAVLDMAEGTGRRAVRVAGQVVDSVPSAARTATHKAAGLVHEADVPGRARDLAEHVGRPDMADKAKHVVSEVSAGLSS